MKTLTTKTTVLYKKRYTKTDQKLYSKKYTKQSFLKNRTISLRRNFRNCIKIAIQKNRNHGKLKVFKL